MEKIKPNKQNVCNAGEYYIASILSAKGFTTTLTLGRAEKYDIIAINPNGKTIKLQVKTQYGTWPKWMMSEKGENLVERDLFYAFVRLNNLEKGPEFWIVPSKIVAHYVKESHKIWLKFPHNPTKAREFRVIRNKFSPKDWKKIKKQMFYNDIEPLLE